MYFLTVLVASIAATIGVQFLFEQNRSYYDSIYKHAELVPISRSVLQNFQMINRNTVVESHIVRTVEDIYLGVKNAAYTRNNGYHHKFNALQPIEKYSPSLYSQEIVRRLEKLFPGCDVELNTRIGMYGVYWYNNTY